MNFSSLRSSLISLIRETFSYRKGGGESEYRWISDQWAQDLPWPGAEGVGRRSGLVLDLDYISASSGGMSLYSGSWIGLLRYQLTHLQVDSGNVRYRRYAPFPSIQALPISSNNNDFHGFNALKFHNNPLHRFCYDHRMPKKPR